MNKILLISDSKGVFQVTKEITQGRYELIWCKYDFWGKGEYPDVDIVIMHFDVDMMERGTFEAIIKVKGEMGHFMPILALVEKGTPQDIFQILEAGAYDYLEITDDMQKYRKKIEELVMWNWYLKKYVPRGQR